MILLISGKKMKIFSLLLHWISSCWLSLGDVCLGGGFFCFIFCRSLDFKVVQILLIYQSGLPPNCKWNNLLSLPGLCSGFITTYRRKIGDTRYQIHPHSSSLEIFIRNLDMILNRSLGQYNLSSHRGITVPTILIPLGAAVPQQQSLAG